MDLVFVHAPNKVYSRKQNYGVRFMPAWAFTLAAHLPGELEARLSFADLQVMEPDEVPLADVYLLSGINQDYDFLVEVSRLLRERCPHARQLLGGPIAWSYQQANALDQLAMFDHICIGDGEELVGEVLLRIAGGEDVPPVMVASRRFDLGAARPMHRGLLEQWLPKYYAGVVHVGRGCPFLCEFCDIRVLEDNNQTRTIDPELVIQEVDFQARRGIRKISLACDNFVGDIRWARKMVDRIIRWQSETGLSVSFYTWITINLFRHPDLMATMRRAGFEILFLGIESFDPGALRETSKVQNILSLPDAVASIQSYGFIVVAGVIFGFDSDEEDFAQKTLDGLERCGLISGDPNWLTALPGTPLHRRMSLSGRLRFPNSTIGGVKYQTNIVYLLPVDVLIAGFSEFIDTYVSGRYQYKRFARLFEILGQGNYIPSAARSFVDPVHFARQSIADPGAITQHLKRAWRIVARPERVYHLLNGLRLAHRHRKTVAGWLGYFEFWVFTWTNALFKYEQVTAGDFDIESVDGDYPMERILPDGYAGTATNHPPTKRDQALYRNTRAQLECVIARGRKGWPAARRSGATNVTARHTRPGRDPVGSRR